MELCSRNGGILGRTLQQAAERGSVEDVQALVALGAVHKFEWYHPEALRLAAVNNHVACVELLVAAGAGGKDEAMYDAAACGATDAMFRLLELATLLPHRGCQDAVRTRLSRGVPWEGAWTSKAPSLPGLRTGGGTR